MTLKSIKEIVEMKIVPFGESWYRTYLERTEFTPYRIGNKYDVCQEFKELVKKTYKETRCHSSYMYQQETKEDLRIRLINLQKDYKQAGRVGYRDWETDRKSTRLNSSHSAKSRMPSSA